MIKAASVLKSVPQLEPTVTSCCSLSSGLAPGMRFNSVLSTGTTNALVSLSRPRAFLTGGLILAVWHLWANPWVVVLIPVFLVVFALGVAGRSNAKEAGISRSTLKRYARGEHEQ